MRTKQTAIAAIFAVSTALSMGAPQVAGAQPAPTAPAPSPSNAAQATAHFQKALGLFQASNFAEALGEFRESYKNVNSPNSHLYIARCLRDLGRLVDAYLEYDKVAAEAKVAGEKYAKTGEQAAAERDELNAKIAKVNVTVASPEVGAQLTIGGVEVPQDQWGKPFPAAPGNVEVKLTAPSKPAVTQSVAAAAGESKDVSVSFPAADPGGGEQPGGGKKFFTPLKVGAFVAGGVGVAGLITFAVAGAASQTTYDKLVDRCGSTACPPELANDVDTGKTQQTLANVGLVVGIVGVAAGATLFVIDMKKKKTDQTQTTWLIGPGTLGVRGTF